ncbi:DUF2236 domain-containing protein [bacterium]|nr:MAG: DUF2236 domain-containing protein [bacterium]
MSGHPLRFAFPFLLVTFAVAQSPIGAPEKAVRSARVRPIAPQSQLPKWLDFDRVQAGYAFLGKHRETVTRVLGTSSLASTFAAKDITPILMRTERLPKDFQQRMRETEAWMAEIFDPPKSRDDFAKREYARAVDLGQMHASVAQMLRGDLKWNPNERVAINGQSFAFVLYSFAWWPIETMVATKEIDPVRDANELDAWFYLWRVLGYGMGAPESLLPRDYAQAKTVVALLRKAQYAAAGEPIPEGIPVLLGGHVRMVAAGLAAQSNKPSDEMLPAAAKALAGLFALSPGMSQALGLGTDPAARLLEYAAVPASK